MKLHDESDQLELVQNDKDIGFAEEVTSESNPETDVLHQPHKGLLFTLCLLEAEV